MQRIMKDILNIIKDSNYSFSLFDQKLVDELERKITIKDGKPYVACAIRGREIVLKPEERKERLGLLGQMKSAFSNSKSTSSKNEEKK